MSDSTLATFRIDKKTWDDFKQLAKDRGSNASSEITRFILGSLGRLDVNLEEVETNDIDTYLENNLDKYLEENIDKYLEGRIDNSTDNNIDERIEAYLDTNLDRYIDKHIYKYLEGSIDTNLDEVLVRLGKLEKRLDSATVTRSETEATTLDVTSQPEPEKSEPPEQLPSEDALEDTSNETQVSEVVHQTEPLKTPISKDALDTPRGDIPKTGNRQELEERRVETKLPQSFEELKKGLKANQLEERLRKGRSWVSKNKDREDFLERTRKSDPDKLGWRWELKQGKPVYFPVW